MKRQQNTPGAIVEIPVDGEYYCYGQIISNGGVVFFDLKSYEKLGDLSL